MFGNTGDEGIIFANLLGVEGAIRVPRRRCGVEGGKTSECGVFRHDGKGSEARIMSLFVRAQPLDRWVLIGVFQQVSDDS